MTQYVTIRPGAIKVQKFGRTPDIDAADTNEEVWDGTGAYTYLAAAATMTISSESANDDGSPAGTGARTVRVYGLDANYAEVVEDVTMNGVTGVELGTDLIRVYRAYVLTVGSVGVNDDNIWIGTGDITDGVPAVKHAGILAGQGQTLMAIYTVPVVADFDGAVILRWYGTCGAVSSSFASLALQTREFGRSWRTRRLSGIGEGGWMVDVMPFGISVPKKTDIRILVVSNGANNTAIEAGFDLALQ